MMPSHLAMICVGMLLSDRFDWLKPYRSVHPQQDQNQMLPLNNNQTNQTGHSKSAFDRKQYEQQLHFQLQLLSHVNDAVIAVDQNEQITYWNQGAVNLYGLDADSVLGRSLVDVLHYEWLHPEEEQLADQALATQGYWRGENIHIRANGDRIFVESSVSVLKDSSGNAIGMIGVLRDISDRKRIAAQLQESQSRLAAVLESVQDVLRSRDLETQKVLAFTDDPTDRVRAETERNQAMAEIQRLNQELEQRVLERTAQLQTAQAELELLNDDLERRVIQRTIELELTNRLLEQEVADRKLSEARYRSLALASAEAVWTTEATGEVEIPQPSWERLTGQRFPDYRGLGWQSAVHPDDRSEVAAQWAKAVATRSTYNSEHRVQIADGSYRYFSVRAVPVFDESGNLLEWVGVHTDITETQQAEQALRRSEQRFRRLAESNIFGVAFGNFAGNILDANDYFLTMTGYDRSDLEAGQIRWLDMTPEEYLPLDWKASAELRQRGVTNPFEKEYIRKNGSRVPILIGSALMNEPYDEQAEIVSFYVDLTARKRAEAERERLLAQEQTARQQAETANRIKDEFLAVLSHELRSPLNPILGWTKLLRTRSFDAATTDRALETIERNAKLQTQLIEDLLDVSRILRGKMSLQMMSVDFVPVVEAAIETVRLSAEAKAIQIEFLPLPASYQLMGDAARLQQVVWNLLSNAIKFTPSGGKVQVRLEEIVGARGREGAGESTIHPSTHPPIYAQITVTDTGKGIHPDFLPHVFEYFRQADSSITRTFGGLGLGLAIVRHLVELHGGTIDVESAGEGQGATFTVRLPLIQGNALVQTEPVALRQLPKAGLLRGVQVLAVDDEADMRDYVKVLLQEAGATVIVASSAREALTTLMRTVPDVLISDIGMPQIDGYTLLKQIRQLSPKQGGQLPAIALTAYAAEYDYHQAIAAGFQVHLSKPIDPDQLVQAIRQLLDAKQLS